MFTHLRRKVWIWRYTRFGRHRERPDTPSQNEHHELMEERLGLLLTNRVLRDVFLYDIDVSDLKLEDYTVDEIIMPKGRALLRELIHREKERRFEATARWIKLFTPLVAAVVGIIGAITGLVAVLRHAK